MCFFVEFWRFKWIIFWVFLARSGEVMEYLVYILKGVKVTTILWYMISNYRVCFISIAINDC